MPADLPSLGLQAAALRLKLNQPLSEPELNVLAVELREVEKAIAAIKSEAEILLQMVATATKALAAAKKSFPSKKAQREELTDAEKAFMDPAQFGGNGQPGGTAVSREELMGFGFSPRKA